jgi:hypothetical protein
MKRLALLGILLLFGGVAVAQQDMGNLSVTGATYATGVVEMTTSDSITIRKDSGEVVTVLLDAKTVGAQERAVGSRVRIDFHLDNQSRAVADEIQGVSPEAAATKPASETKVAPAVTPEASAPVAETAAPAETTAAPVTATQAPAETKLPATASPLPGLALLGLLAISGAVTLRAVR